MTIHIAEGDIATRTRAIVADLRFLEGPLLPILHGV
ncbi:formate dehydrogenase subunit gamma, partial [Bradyrhizobium sp. Lot11]